MNNVGRIQIGTGQGGRRGGEAATDCLTEERLALAVP